METNGGGQWDPRSADGAAVAYRSELPSEATAYPPIEPTGAYHSDPVPQSHYAASAEQGYGTTHHPAAAPQYRPHSPTSGGAVGFSPGYKATSGGYGTAPSLDTHPVTATRHGSFSSASIASPNDYGSSWTSSPTMSQPGTRNNSIYSLDGHMTGASLADTRFAPLQQASGYPVDRRFSLDERARPLGNSLLPHRAPQTAAGLSAMGGGAGGLGGRHWPWGGATTATNALSGVPSSSSSASSSATAGRSSYDYGYATNRPLQAGGAVGGAPYGSTSYESFNPAGIPPGADPAMRIRSMSSSAASGRYTGPGGPLGTAAAMGLTPAGHYDPLDAATAGAHHHAPVGPSVGPGGGVTRRAKFKRSRTGCLVCRKRKVKCSQDGIPCKQCRIGKRDCYYETDPPKRKRKGKESKEGSGDNEGDVSLAASTSSSSSTTGKKMPKSASSSSIQGGGGMPTMGGPSSYAAPPPPGVAFNMPFGHHADPNMNGAAHHTYAPPPTGHHPDDGAGHGGAAAPTFGSAGWPAPPGGAHHRDSFSDSVAPHHPHNNGAGGAGGYDAADAHAAYQQQQQQHHRGSFDAGPHGPPHGLGHVMQGGGGEAAPPPQAWYGAPPSGGEQDPRGAGVYDAGSGVQA